MGLFARYSGKVPFVVYTGTSVNGNATGNFSTSASLSTAAGTRKIAVAIYNTLGTGSSSISGVTIAGVSATRQVRIAGSGVAECAIWTALVPTGTSGTIAITGPTGNWFIALAVYAIYDAVSITAVASSTKNLIPVSMSLTMPGNAVAIGIAGRQSTPASSTTCSGLTLDFDTAFSVSGRYGAAHGTFQSPITQSITFTFGRATSGTEALGCCAAFT